MKYTFVAHRLPFGEYRTAAQCTEIARFARTVLMKFTIEQRHLTDQSGKPVRDVRGR
ncbi:MAG TPA: hypothetical protein VG323_06720 [Thermoanaerobaculia bacterium]|nr:hypothetical protein [Thermoanaerobaculia bacterium]